MKLSQLLDSKPKWQHKDSAVRLKAVNTSDLSQEAILTLATDDPDAQVKIAAINKLSEPSTLLTLWQSSQSLEESSEERSEKSPEIKKSLVSRWATLTESMPNPAISVELTEAFLQDLVNSDAGVELKLAAVDKIVSQTNLLQIMQGQHHSRIYQCVTEKITEEDLLHKVQKLFLNRDKNVLKITKQKLSKLKALRADLAAFQADVDRILKAMQKLAASEFADDFERKLSALNEKWTSFAPQSQDITTDQQIQFDEALKQCQATISRKRAEEEALEEQVNEILNTLFELTQKLRTSTAALSDISATVKSCRAGWPHGRDLAHLYALTSPLEQLSDQNQQWLKIQSDLKSQNPAQLIRRLDMLHWPTGFAAPTEIDTTRIQLTETISEIDKTKAEEKLKLDGLDTALNALEQAISEGHVKQANKLISTLRTKIEKADAPAKYQNQLNEFSTKLKELKDWQGYATNPKREELCLAMEALASDEAMPPMKKSTAIKELQDQWKKLGASDSRQGQKLWAKFKQLGDKAFEPCATHFQEQKQLRQENLEKKRALCTNLESYFEQQDWQVTDWKSVNDLINKSRKEWRASDDIQRSKRKKIYERYTQAMNAIQAKLSAEQDNNHTLKLGYIQAITDLLETDAPLSRLIPETKSIQTQWTSVGPTRRQQDQKLWRLFRTECDKVFAKRDENKQAEQKQADATTVAGREVLDALKRYLDSDVIQQSEINRFRKQFTGLDFGHKRNPLSSEFQKLTKTASRLIEQQVSASKKQMMVEFKRLASLCSSLEEGALDKTQFEAEWNSEIELDAKLSQRIDARKSASLSQAEPEGDQDAETICIRLEILSDIDSPAESQQTRMAYQVQRLQKELAQGIKETRSPVEQAQTLLLDWYCLSSKSVSKQQQGRVLLAEAKLGI